MAQRISKKKIKFFQENILEWYQQHGRHFKWREEGLSPYQYIIAEVLLQRTKAETVAKFYPKFLQTFTSWESLANAEPGKVEEFLKPVGLYRQRAQRLINLSKEMVKRKGILPTDRTELEEIPFMGQYIANAVELIIFNRPLPLVDVNMARVLERFFGERDLADIRYDTYLQELSYKITNHQNAKNLNWGVLDFAAIICTAKKPNCKICLFSCNCEFICKKSK